MTDEVNERKFKSWSEEDKPREKLISRGAHELSTTELLAIFLRTGFRDKNVLDLARQILIQVNYDLDALAKMSVSQFTKIKGIGKVKAVTIAAALELGRRRKDTARDSRSKLSSSRDVYEYIYPEFADRNEENFISLLMSRSNHVIKKTHISKGGVAGTTVDPKIIFKDAIENLASNIILIHNHPSGNLQPSVADINLTKKVKEGAALFDIQLLDHLIFTNEGFYSFADEGVL